MSNIEMRCVSFTGELLRISAFEFTKKIMSNSKASKLLVQNAKEKIYNYLMKSCMRYQSI